MQLIYTPVQLDTQDDFLRVLKDAYLAVYQETHGKNCYVKFVFDPRKFDNPKELQKFLDKLREDLKKEGFTLKELSQFFILGYFGYKVDTEPFGTKNSIVIKKLGRCQ